MKQRYTVMGVICFFTLFSFLGHTTPPGPIKRSFTQMTAKEMSLTKGLLCNQCYDQYGGNHCVYFPSPDQCGEGPAPGGGTWCASIGEEVQREAGGAQRNASCESDPGYQKNCYLNPGDFCKKINIYACEDLINMNTCKPYGCEAGALLVSHFAAGTRQVGSGSKCDHQSPND